AEAAVLVGWSPANLRSHRMRYWAEQIAASLPQAQADVLRSVRAHGAGQEPRLEGYEGPRLFRREGRAWGLTRMGLEVERRTGHVGRRSPPPPPAVEGPGPVRYRRADVMAWLEQHPEHGQREHREALTWGYRETAGAMGVAVQ